jgi:hypothetical protein
VSVRERAGESRDDMVVAALHRLAPHLDGEPDPDFRAATRARLVAMAAVRSPQPEPVSGLKRLLTARRDGPTPARWRPRLTAALAGAALTVTAAASLVALADGARPGDVLYGLKRGTEQTQLALAGDTRGTTLLGFASTRLDELEQLVDAPTALPAAGAADDAGGSVLAAGADPELVISTLETMDDETSAGTAWLTDRAVTSADEAPLDDVSVWVATQAADLAALAPELPDAAGAAVSHSLTLLSAVSARADGLQVALACSSGPAVGPADALGPVPAPCVPAVAGTPGEQPGTGVPAPGTTTGDVPPTGAVPTPGTGSGDTGSGSGGGGLPVPGTPTVPGGPALPTIPGLPTSVTVPTLPVPGTPGGPPAKAPSVSLCLPPLPKIGNC